VVAIRTETLVLGPFTLLLSRRSTQSTPPPRGGESSKIFAPSGEQVRLVCWRFRLTDYVGVLGYGTKGRNAFRGRRCACRRAVPRDQIRRRPTPTRWPQQAAPAWSPYRARDACRGPVANTDRAGGVVVVAPGRDDTAVLSTLPARRRSPRLAVVFSTRLARCTAEGARTRAHAGWPYRWLAVIRDGPLSDHGGRRLRHPTMRIGALVTPPSMGSGPPDHRPRKALQRAAGRRGRSRCLRLAGQPVEFHGGHLASTPARSCPVPFQQPVPIGAACPVAPPPAAPPRRKLQGCFPIFDSPAPPPAPDPDDVRSLRDWLEQLGRGPDFDVVIRYAVPAGSQPHEDAGGAEGRWSHLGFPPTSAEAVSRALAAP